MANGTVSQARKVESEAISAESTANEQYNEATTSVRDAKVRKGLFVRKRDSDPKTTILEDEQAATLAGDSKLREALGDIDSHVRDAAETALAKIGEEKSE